MSRYGAVLVALAGCGSSPPPPSACELEVLAHLTPLPPSSDPFDYQYSEVAAKDGVAYLGAAHEQGVQVLDVGTGERLAVLDPGHADINSVALAGNLLAVAPARAGLVVYDVTSARAPAGRAQLLGPARNCHTVFIHRDIVYCSTFSGAPPHLVLYRVTTGAPLAVAAVGSYTATIRPEESGSYGAIHDVFVHERAGRTIAYLAYWEHGLEIVDVTDPAAPVRLGATAPTPRRWTHSVWVDGDHAYVGEESYQGILRILDVSNLEAPVEVGQLRSTEGDANSVHNVQVANGFVYASWYQDGLRVFPARGPADTREVAHFHTWNGADNRDNPASFKALYTGDWDVFVDGDRIYASDMQTGLWVLRHQPGPVCAPDRSRGSAYARAGRPPIGFGTFSPRQARAGRTVEIRAYVSAADTDFAISDALLASLGASVEVTGAPVTPLEVVSTGGVAVPTRILRRTATLPETPGSLRLTAALTDGGARRRLGEDIPILPPAPPNEDAEPNDTPALSGLIRVSTGPVRVTGSLDAKDLRDLYDVDRPAATALQIRLLTAADPERDEPALQLTAGGRRPGRAPLVDAAHPELVWEQLVTIDAGGAVSLEVAGAPEAASRYLLEVTPVQ